MTQETEHNGVVAVEATETGKDARQLLADITAGLDGVTPGPWHLGHLGTDSICQCRGIVNEGYAGGIATICVGNRKPISNGGNDCPPPEEAASNMRHIARCDPDTMQAIADLVAEQAQRIAKLEAERQWRLIKTAPRDKTHIFIAVPTKDQDGYLVGEGYFDPEPDNGAEEGEWWWAGTGRDNYFDSSINEGNWHLPTHWKHLPPAPLPASPHEGAQA